jgi:hypothetical protein
LTVDMTVDPFKVEGRPRVLKSCGHMCTRFQAKLALAGPLLHSAFTVLIRCVIALWLLYCVLLRALLLLLLAAAATNTLPLLLLPVLAQQCSCLSKRLLCASHSSIHC